MRRIHEATAGRYLIWEQLEERIVLDGAVDDISHRAELLSAQTSDADAGSHDDPDSHVAVSTEAAQSPTVDLLALEAGTEWLQDGTWHYWERDWDGDGNGYEFHSWQDGSSSFHQIQWDAASNSKGTHNGFDYNLQRDGSWTYQAAQWDASQNGYSYDATSGGTYHYESHQWVNGLGYDYTSHSNGKWTYHTIGTGMSSGDKAEYMADSTGWGDYTYTWANGQTWHTDTAVAGQETFHVIDNIWSYEYVVSTDTGYWKKTSESNPLFSYNYNTAQWYDQGKTGGWETLGPVGITASFLGDGSSHRLDSTWLYDYSSSLDTGYWTRVGDTHAHFAYDYDTGQWDHGSDGAWSTLGTGLDATFVGDGAWHVVRWYGSAKAFEYLYQANGGTVLPDASDRAFWKDNGTLRFSYDYEGQQWYDTSSFNKTVLGNDWSSLGGNVGHQDPGFLSDDHTIHGNTGPIFVKQLTPTMVLYYFAGYYNGGYASNSYADTTPAPNSNPWRLEYDYVYGNWVARWPTQSLHTVSGPETSSLLPYWPPS